MNAVNPHYPFAALVGQEPLKTALLIAAVDPSLGGVLIRGEKGTAKSTAARALARLLRPIRFAQDCPFRCDPDRPWPDCPACAEALASRMFSESPTPHVDLPLGATEDRVLGTLDLERVLEDGRTALKPGLLAEAHRGILYIDEVNLLADHLVDVLLDVATSGVNSVQRDGVAARHPARFLLIGSMNPEEGELRPQLLDRFGLMVEVAAPRDFELRAEVVRRRLEFEVDPARFGSRWSEDEQALGERIASARQRLQSVALPDGLLTAIARLCAEAQVDGLRADIALYKASRALAALDGRSVVLRADVRAAAEFVLPHRQRRQPAQQPGLNRDALDRALGPEDGKSPDGPQPSPPAESRDPSSEMRPQPDPADVSASDWDRTVPPSTAEDRVIEPGGPVSIPRLDLDPLWRIPTIAPGKHAVKGLATQGAYIRAIPDSSPRELDVNATLRAAARRGGLPKIERADFHGKQREARASTLILFVVDTSGSMGARKRMEAAKAVVLSLLDEAYLRRDRVAAIAFGGPRAKVVLTPSRSIDLAESALRRLPTGGRTPLADALTMAADLIRSETRNGPTMVVLLTDGKANVTLPGIDGDPWNQAITAARTLAAIDVPAIVFDTEEGFGRSGRAAELAHSLGAELLPLAGLSADSIRARIDPSTSNGGRP